MITFTKDMELNSLDMLNLLSFVIGLENLELNITQDNLDKQTAELDEKVNADVDRALKVIQEHLTIQDMKLNGILSILEEMKDGKIKRNVNERDRSRRK